MAPAPQKYGRLSIGEFFALKHTLCRFFQDRRVKVSLFLQDGTQNMDGTIVLDPTGPLPVGTDAPGRVVYRNGSVSTGDLRELHIEGTLPPLTGSPYDPEKRPCKLGLNMYAKDRSKRGPKKQPVRLKRGGSKPMMMAAAPRSEAKEDANGGDESKVCAGVRVMLHGSTAHPRSPRCARLRRVGLLQRDSTCSRRSSERRTARRRQGRAGRPSRSKTCLRRTFFRGTHRYPACAVCTVVRFSDAQFVCCDCSVRASQGMRRRL